MSNAMLMKTNLKLLRLPTIAAEWEKLGREATTRNETYEQYLLKLTELELSARQSKALQTRIKQASFPIIKDFDTFDFAAIPGINKQKVLELARCEWIEKCFNLCLLGNSGTGKTHLATALGLAACRQGKKVRFLSAAGLVGQLEKAQKQYQLDRFLSQLEKIDLLICDELGYLSFSRGGAELLFQVFADRYERGSILLTTNLPFSEWDQIFQGERMTGALLDRLTHRCHIFEMNGESYRFRESMKDKKAKASKQVEPHKSKPT